MQEVLYLRLKWLLGVHFSLTGEKIKDLKKCRMPDITCFFPFFVGV